MLDNFTRHSTTRCLAQLHGQLGSWQTIRMMTVKVTLSAFYKCPRHWTFMMKATDPDPDWIERIRRDSNCEVMKGCRKSQSLMDTRFFWIFLNRNLKSRHSRRLERPTIPFMGNLGFIRVLAAWHRSQRLVSPFLGVAKLSSWGPNHYQLTIIHFRLPWWAAMVWALAPCPL